MSKTKVGLVTAWGECGMGYVARNWVYTFNKFPDKIDFQIYSRALPWLTPFRWHGKNIINGPEKMDINHPHFWEWIDNFKPDVILFQDQNIYGHSKMQEETTRLRNLGIKLINYPDWILRGDTEQYRGLYDVNLSHVIRNHKWLKEANVDNPILIPWGVILKNFPFNLRTANNKITFYINIGTGTLRKGYNFIPCALKKMQGNFIQRHLFPNNHNYKFIASSVENSIDRVNKRFVKYFNKDSKCDLVFQTADNNKGGLFHLGQVYIYPTTKEGIGLTITEAMASGLPVVTTDYPTMNEWIDDNIHGRLIKPKKIIPSSMPMDKVLIDTSHLAEIMIDYIENPLKIEEHSINARKHIKKNYNWDDRDIEILNLIKF
tara:strand:+ start:2492 stop:3616 length:1125 start_codon:yes stop_codon:yes gene_type:complete